LLKAACDVNQHDLGPFGRLRPDELLYLVLDRFHPQGHRLLLPTARVDL
jgi:hypothetical protein